MESGETMGARRLASGLDRRVIAEHFDKSGAVRRDLLTLRGVSYYDTDGGAPRVRIQVGGLAEVKALLSHRVRAFENPETGERDEDVNGYLAALLDEVGGAQPDSWPDPNANRLMTSDIDIAFDDNGLAEGFVFGVRAAFRKALDIQRVAYDKGKRKRWMRGVPPLLSFEDGDRFESPPTPRTGTAAECRRWRQTVHVEDAEPDAMNGGGVRRDGWVGALVTAYAGGEAIGRHRLSTSQAGFLEFLRTGEPPPHVDPPTRETPAPVAATSDDAVSAEGSGGADSGLIAIDYCDSKGQVTRRRIIVREVEDIGLDLMIHATCLERHAARTFYGSRVRTVFDPETGEIPGEPREVLRRFIPQDA